MRSPTLASLLVGIEVGDCGALMLVGLREGRGLILFCEFVSVFQAETVGDLRRKKLLRRKFDQFSLV